MPDLDTAVGLLREAADAYPQGHHERATLLNLIALLIVNKWGCFKDSVDDNEALNAAQAAFDATTEEHPCRAESKRRLVFFKAYMKSETGVSRAISSIAYMSRFVNALFSYENARASATTTILAYLPNWVSKPAATLVAYVTDWVSNSATQNFIKEVADESVLPVSEGLMTDSNRYIIFASRMKEIWDESAGRVETADLDRMIHMTQNELESHQKDDDFKLVLVSTLGELFGDKYLHTGDENTIQEAVRLAQEVVDSTPEGHQDSTARISNLGLQLGRRWQCCRHKEDLDLSITMARTALRQPNSSPSIQANLYFNLGARLGDEYLVARGLGVLKEAVDYLRKAIQIAPPEEINRTEFLVSLGRLLHDRYTHEGEVQDLEEAIRRTREARALGQQNEVDKAKTSAYLGLYLSSQFIRTGEISDLDQAIDETECAANTLSNDHIEELAWLNNLAIQIGDKYFRSGAAADLERAIEIMREVVAKTKSGDPNRPSRLSNLALRLGDRYARLGALADLNEAIELMRATLTIEPQLSQSDQPLLLNNISIRLAERWNRTGNEEDLDEAVRRSQEAVEKSRPDHQDITRWCINLGIHLAARYQLKGDQEDFEKANEAYQKAASTIPDEHPYRAALFNNMGLLFAEKYTHSNKLEDLNKAIGHSRDSVSATATDATSWAMRSRNLARQLYQRYLHEDQTEDRSESRELLIRALRSSTASIKVRVAAGRDFIFTEDKLDDPQSYDILKRQSPKPHIWWIPTGKLTRLPLHAAGNHLQADGSTTLDMVISSYASSIKAIVRSRRQSTPMSLDASSLRVVAVAMEQTEKQRRLRYAAREVDQVLSTLGMKATPQSRPQTYKHDVLSAIKACDIFHFAGHGQTHATAPLESSLLLSDWEKNPLTVQNFMEGDLANDNPFLAYLSACGTSRMKDEGALDENIHLVNACQLAGFRHVVGTLWSVDDEQCVQMARKVYEFMVMEGFRDDTVSRGLHYATKFLRDRWVQSHSRQESLQVAREAEVIEDHISQPDWVPYIHFGL
ncbi:hypothetical protein LQW54_005938 [Pestalotiopsis sp. IQ-011]